MVRRALVLAGVLIATLSVPSAGRAEGGCLDYPSFSATTGLTLFGSAAKSGTALRLTPAQTSKTGAAWAPGDLTGGRVLETTFTFAISNPGGFNDSAGNPGGDGFAFVIQAASSPAVGAGGGTLGYQGIPNSLAVEFDTWKNASIGDPDGNHVGIHSRGQDPNGAWEGVARVSTSDVPDLSDGAAHTVRISYAPPAVVPEGMLSVYVDDMDAPKLEDAVDLATLLDLSKGPLWVGFTASTGAAFENHDIASWSVCTLVPANLVPDPYILGVQGTTPTVKAPAVSATLSTFGETPAGIEGKTIAFYTTASAPSPDTLICTAVTDADGTAQCTPANDQIQAVVQGLGFVAKFDGENVYTSSAVVAPLVQVGTTKIPM